MLRFFLLPLKGEGDEEEVATDGDDEGQGRFCRLMSKVKPNANSTFEVRALIKLGEISTGQPWVEPGNDKEKG